MAARASSPDCWRDRRGPGSPGAPPRSSAGRRRRAGPARRRSRWRRTRRARARYGPGCEAGRGSRAWVLRARWAAGSPNRTGAGPPWSTSVTRTLVVRGRTDFGLPGRSLTVRWSRGHPTVLDRGGPGVPLSRPLHSVNGHSGIATGERYSLIRGHCASARGPSHAVLAISHASPNGPTAVVARHRRTHLGRAVRPRRGCARVRGDGHHPSHRQSELHLARLRVRVQDRHRRSRGAHLRLGRGPARRLRLGWAIHHDHRPLGRWADVQLDIHPRGLRGPGQGRHQQPQPLHLRSGGPR